MPKKAHPTLEMEVSFKDDLISVGKGFAQAAFLTVQETINIFPRTLNLIPLIDIGELDFFHLEGNELDYTRLEGSLRNGFSKSAGSPEAGAIAAVAFNVFVLLYIPCVSAISAMNQEFGQRWMWAQISYTLIIAWARGSDGISSGKVTFPLIG